MNCPKCKNVNAHPRRCANCGHRWEYKPQAAMALVLTSRRMRSPAGGNERPCVAAVQVLHGGTGQ